MRTKKDFKNFLKELKNMYRGKLVIRSDKVFDDFINILKFNNIEPDYYEIYKTKGMIHITNMRNIDFESRFYWKDIEQHLFYFYRNC